MGDLTDSGWRIVGRQPFHVEEAQTLQTWDKSPKGWSGFGKHAPLDHYAMIHSRFDRRSVLGEGGYGKVMEVEYKFASKKVVLARKRIKAASVRRTVEQLLQEAHVMERLVHEHVVKMVGTYQSENSLCILTWPVATCSLHQFLEDLDNLNRDAGDSVLIRERMDRLGLSHPNIANSGQIPYRKATDFLCSTLGCIAEALSYCHRRDVRHLDLKPHNILVDRGQVYLTDFGIARDVMDCDHTFIAGTHGTRKWGAPEIWDRDDQWSAQKAEIYSLGLVFLGIVSILYGSSYTAFNKALSESLYKRDAILVYTNQLRGGALASQEFADDQALTCGPKHIMRLIARMLSLDPAERCTTDEINTELGVLGGISQVYHGPCCRLGDRAFIQAFDSRAKEEVCKLQDELVSTKKKLQRAESDKDAEIQRVLFEQTSKLEIALKKAEVEAEVARVNNADLIRLVDSLRSVNANWETRLKTELEKAASVMNNLREQEKKKREELEKELEGLRQNRRHPMRHGPGRGRGYSGSRERPIVHQNPVPQPLVHPVHGQQLSNAAPPSVTTSTLANTKVQNSPGTIRMSYSKAASVVPTTPTPRHPLRPSPLTPQSASAVSISPAARSPRPDASPNTSTENLTRVSSYSKIPRPVSTGAGTPSRSQTPTGYPMRRNTSQTATTNTDSTQSSVRSKLSQSIVHTADTSLQSSLVLPSPRPSPRPMQGGFTGIPIRSPGLQTPPISGPPPAVLGDSGIMLLPDDDPVLDTTGKMDVPPRPHSPALSVASHAPSIASIVSGKSAKSAKWSEVVAGNVPSAGASRHQSVAPSQPGSVLSSPRTANSELHVDGDMIKRMSIPTIPSMPREKSWAAVAGIASGTKMMLTVGSKRK